MSPRKNVYPWDRFWCSPDGIFSYDDQGFLLDPSGLWSLPPTPDVVPASSFDAVKCLTLLGEPGMGKSSALMAMLNKDIELGRETMIVDLAQFSSDESVIHAVFSSPQLKKWLDTNDTLCLYLDSLDECLIHVRTVAKLLASQLSKFPVDRLRLRIACRSSDWPALLSEELPQIWKENNYKVAELLPLRRKDVEIAANIRGVDSKKFLSAIMQSNAVPFAIVPITLDMLFSRFGKTQSLEGSQSDFYYEFIGTLCTETSKSRKASKATGRLSPPKRFKLASRIAAMSFLCNKQRISLSPWQAGHKDTSYLSISDIAGGVEHAEDGDFKVSPEAVKDTLQCSVFTQVGEDGRGWLHNTYREFLAADYLVNCPELKANLETLLFSDGLESNPRGSLYPQLHEIARWISMKDPIILNMVIQSDPQVLLTKQSQDLPAEARVEIVKKLLAATEQKAITDIRTRYPTNYSNLSTPSLSELLAQTIPDHSKSHDARRMAIEIAEECSVIDLLPILSRVANDTGEDITTRHYAARTIFRIGGTSAAALLKPLREGSDVDRDDGLKAYAIRSAWPNDLSAEKCFSLLTAAKRRDYIGAYQMLFRQHIVEHLKTSDLHVGIRWVGAQGKDAKLPVEIKALVTQIMARAWDDLHTPKVMEAFIPTALKRLKDMDQLFGDITEERQWATLEKAPNKRRDLVAALLPHMAQAGLKPLWICYSPNQLVSSSDRPWLLDWFDSEKSTELRISLAEVISRTLNNDDQDSLLRVWEGCEKDPEMHKAAAWWFEAISLDSSDAKYGREHLRREELREKQRESQARLLSDLKKQARQTLVEIGQGKTHAWSAIDQALLNLRKEQVDGELDHIESDHQIQESGLSVDELKGSLAAAVDYLGSEDPQSASWMGTNRVPLLPARGSRALRLLYSEGKENLDSLDNQSLIRWFPVLIFFPIIWNNGTDTISHGLAYYFQSRLGLAFSQEVIKVIEASFSTNNRLDFLEKLVSCWNDDLARAVLAFLSHQSNLPMESFEALWANMLENEPDRVIGDLKKQLESLSNISQDRRDLLVSLLMIFCSPHEFDYAWKMVKNKPKLAISVLKKVARYEGRFSATGMADKLSDKALSELCQLLFMNSDLYVSSKATSHNRTLRPYSDLEEFSGNLLARLRTAGTKDAHQGIENIGEATGWPPLLVYSLQESRAQLVSNDMVFLMPSDFKSVINTPKISILNSGRDLRKVVVMALDRYKISLSGSLPASADLWNDKVVKHEPPISDHIVRFLRTDLLNEPIVLNREVQPRPGQHTDIYVDAIYGDSAQTQFSKLSLVLEVKGIWNDEIETAMQIQLREKYMVKNNLMHGIYVVLWIDKTKWSPVDPKFKKTSLKWSKETTIEYFDQQAHELSKDGLHITSYVIDITNQT